MDKWQKVKYVGLIVALPPTPPSTGTDSSIPSQEGETEANEIQEENIFNIRPIMSLVIVLVTPVQKKKFIFVTVFLGC